MKLNKSMCNNLIFSRSHTKFSTRLHVNDKLLDRKEEQKILGLWMPTYLDQERNTQEMCKKAFARIQMLSKLKYIGTKICDLVTIYVMYIRCLLEYCSVVWHPALTESQRRDIELVQAVSLKVITI